jgi:hypothetical protein
MEHVTFPVLDDTGTRVVRHEVLEVEREAPRVVRLTHSPAFVAGAARGDLIELDPDLLSGFRVLERSGMLAAVVAFKSKEQKRNAERELGIDVQALGGVCEGGPGRALVFSMPVGTGFPTVEGFLDGARTRFPGAEWYFGNVYGPDGAPLNWWP